MDDDAAPRAPTGVPMQVHAYVCAPSTPGLTTPPPSSRTRHLATTADNSQLIIKEGKTVELVNGSDVLGLRVDHVYQQGTEQDVMERSLQSLVAACAEGVNTAVLALGSTRSGKSDLLFRKMSSRSLASAMVHALLKTLDGKTSGSNSERQSYSFVVRVSFAELYEETIRDLLASEENTRVSLTIEDDNTCEKHIKNLTVSAPLTSVEDFDRILSMGYRLRRQDSGLYGNASEFSSAILRISVRQVFRYQDAPTQELQSYMDIVDLPATNRLARSGDMVRLSEGPLLNKSLFAFADCLEEITRSANENSKPGVLLNAHPSFDSSQLTLLLQGALGATFSLGRRLPFVKNYPVVNNDVIRGLLLRCNRQFTRRNLRDCSPRSMALPSQNDLKGNENAYLAKIVELEGKLNQEMLQKTMMKEDKDRMVLVMNELKAKYQQLFDNELEIRKELLACEQEKLSLSKAFVDFQVEKNDVLQDLDSQKFELETKLIQAEEMVMQIQDDDNKKASQIHDLCQKVDEIIHEKQVLGEELSLLQSKCQQFEQTVSQEEKKNQQLSLELLVLVNQKQKYQKEMEVLQQESRDNRRRIDDAARVEQELRDVKEQMKNVAHACEQQMDALRKEIARKEVDLERSELGARKAHLEAERHAEGLVRERESDLEKDRARLLSEVTALTQEKSAMQLRVERLSIDYEKATKEKEDLVALWVTKTQEYEDLLVTNERLHHENQSQLDEYRLKVAFIQSNPGNDFAINELIQSYQIREKDLRGRLSTCQHKMHRLMKHRRYPETSAPHKHPSDELSAVGSDPTSDQDHGPRELTETNNELPELHNQLWHAEQQIAKEMEQVATLTLKCSELQKALDKEKQERKELKKTIQASTGNTQQRENQDMTATRHMQELLLAQLGEVRKLALDQKSELLREIPAQPQISASGGQVARAVPSNETGSLNAAAEKSKLEQKLLTSKAEWTKIVEQVERRCADLLTQNVMLTEENQQLQQTLQSMVVRFHQQQRK